MKLEDAVDEGAEVVKRLSGRDAIAVHVLVELGQRVLKSRRAIRSLADAVSPETHLNQEPLLGLPTDEEKL